jgi:hypothetical protein
LAGQFGESRCLRHVALVARQEHQFEVETAQAHKA